MVNKSTIVSKDIEYLEGRVDKVRDGAVRVGEGILLDIVESSLTIALKHIRSMKSSYKDSIPMTMRIEVILSIENAEEKVKVYERSHKQI